MKKSLILMVAIFMVVGFKFNFDKDDKTLIRVGDSKMTIKEFDERVASLPEQYKAFYSTPEGKKQLIENLRKEFLMYELAKRDKYETDEDVLKQLDEVKKQIVVAVYLKDKVDENVKVTKSEKKAYFKEHKEEFISKEQVKASHILVKTEKESKDILAKLKKGADFTQLAKDYSIDPSAKQNNGDLGSFGRGQMVKPFENAAFALDVGEYTEEAVETQYGFHIIKVTEKTQGKEMTYEDVKEDLETFLLQKKQKELLDKLIEKAESKIKVEDYSEQLFLAK
jgi:peptidyl-prolyl cis-trans isomerase C